jgi:hypothetical protein
MMVKHFPLAVCASFCNSVIAIPLEMFYLCLGFNPEKTQMKQFFLTAAIIPILCATSTFAQQVPMNFAFTAEPDTLLFGTTSLGGRATLKTKIIIEAKNGEVTLVCPRPFRMIVGKDSGVRNHTFVTSGYTNLDMEVYCEADKAGVYDDTLKITINSTIYIYLKATILPLSVEDNNNNLIARAYPNPSHSSITFLTESEATIEIIDLLSRHVATSDGPVRTWVFTPPSKGTYFAKIISADRQELRKLIAE